MTSVTRRRFLIAGAATPAIVIPAMARAKTILPLPRATEGRSTRMCSPETWTTISSRSRAM
jgi:hypothetical protein